MVSKATEEALQEQMIEVAVAQAREKASSGFSVFNPGGEVGEHLEGGRMGMTVSEDAAGTVTLYNTDTHEPVEILINMLAKTLKKKRHGKPAFSIEKTGEFKKGDVICYLSPNHPDREYYRELGIHQDCATISKGDVVVSADHLASEMDREIHMQHKHTRAWNIILADQERREKEEDRELRRQEIAAMMELAKVARSEK